MEIIKIKYNKDNIIKQSEEVERCFKCSACSIFCPVTLNVSKYNIENAFISQIFGSMDEQTALNDVWMCCACEKCVITCPQDADPTEVFTNLKQLSYQKGLAPEAIYSLIRQLINTGIAYDIGRTANAARKKFNLKEFEINTKTSEELKTLARKTGLKIKEVE